LELTLEIAGSAKYAVGVHHESSGFGMVESGIGYTKQMSPPELNWDSDLIP